MPGEPRSADLLEALYRVDLPEQAWSDAVFQAFAPSVPGTELASGFFFDSSWYKATLPRTDKARIDKAILSKALSAKYENARMAELMTSELPPSVIERMFPMNAMVDSARRRLEAGDSRPFHECLGMPFPIPVQDAWAVAGTNLQGQGYLLSAGMSSVVAPLPASLLRRWRRVAVHLSAAFCLRENMARGLAPGEGILAPDGRLLHATGSARLPDARDALRLAVRGIDAARSRHRQDPESSLQAWQAVVSGRWTLVEQHERDGKRFLLARVNELQAPGSKALSLRERQVLGLVAQGASNKEIGYRLGIGEPSVAGYLRRGKAKVGLKNRTELLRWWQSQTHDEG